MNKEQIVAIIQRGHFTDGDLADALLAELAKVSEPAGFIAHNPGGFYEGSHIPAAPYDYAKFHNGLPTAGTKLFTHPLPQPDLVAEIEQLRQQLSAAQASEDELLKALEECKFALEPYDDVKPRNWETDRVRLRYAHQSVVKAITTHKSRKEKA